MYTFTSINCVKKDKILVNQNMNTITLEKKLPFVSLKTTQGPFNLKSILPKKALLFYFLGNHQDPAALKLIHGLNLKNEELNWLACELILVTDLPLEAAKNWAETEDLLFPVVSDEGDSFKKAFVGSPDKAAFFLFDRYGSLQWWTVATTDAELPDAEAVYNEVLYLSSQCPECGV